MTTRYDATPTILNNNSRYSNLFSKRKVKYIQQFTTPILDHPIALEIRNLQTISHIWKEGDRFWKLAYDFYGERSNLWWIIAWFNRTPTEGHVKVGDVITIPLPVEKILEYYGF